MIAWMSLHVLADSITAAELEALAAAKACAAAYLQGPAVVDRFLKQYAPWSYAIDVDH